MVSAAAQSPLQSSYDFIVVGGGTAGLVVGTRLSEIAGISVLIIEDGSHPTVHKDWEVPGANNLVLGQLASAPLVSHSPP